MAERIAFSKIAATGGHRNQGSSAKRRPPWGWCSVRLLPQVEYIVGKYLDVHNSSGAQQVAAPALTDLVANNDLASCFTRRRNAKPKKVGWGRGWP